MRWLEQRPGRLSQRLRRGLGGGEAEQLQDIAGARRRNRTEPNERVRTRREAAGALPHCLRPRCSSRSGSDDPSHSSRLQRNSWTSNLPWERAGS